MFFEEIQRQTRPMKRRQLNALLATWEKELHDEPQTIREFESGLNETCFLKIQPSVGSNAHCGASYILAA